MLSVARRRLLRASVSSVLGVPSAGSALIRPCFQYTTVHSPRSLSSQAQDGSPWTRLNVRNSVAWQQAVRPSLLTFLRMEKHLLVPVKFKVPVNDEAWPKTAWGYPLGKHAEWLRKQWRQGGAKINPMHKKELDEMQFAWDWPQYKWDHFVLPALRRFHDLNGHTDVHAHFVVPKEDPTWPERLWGKRLGNTVLSIRIKGSFAKQTEADAEELKRLKFCHDSVLSERNWREKVLPSLKVFRDKFDHCCVESTFTVPQSPPWPETAWEMSLGRIVKNIRHENAYAEYVSRDKLQLEAIGFVWNFIEAEWSERILPALQFYHQLNGHCRVPFRFVIPSDGNWPKQTWGLKLGGVVRNIRGVNSYAAQVSRDKPQLEAIGFIWDFFEAEWSVRILPALQFYHQLNGHCRVPFRFVIPSDGNWPKQTWGLRLGNVIRSIRGTNSYAAQVSRDKPQLEAIGFAWNFFEAEWNKSILPALKILYKLHGHSRVPTSFEVPSDAAWPAELHGLKLGRAVKSIRDNGTYFDQTTRSLDELEAIEFRLEIPVAKWKQRVEPLLTTFEDLFGQRSVPLDFVVPSRTPWEEKDWGIPLGKLQRKGVPGDGVEAN